MSKKEKASKGWDKVLVKHEEVLESPDGVPESKPIMENSRLDKIRYSWGSKKLDSLTGGIECGVLHEIYGEAMSCKTTLAAYNSICMIAKKEPLTPKDRFIIVDCDGGFDNDRAKQIWEYNKLDVGDIAAHIEYYQPTDFASQHDIITGLGKKIKDEEWNPKLIVVDAMTAAYRGIFLRTNMTNKMSVCGIYTGKLDLQLCALRRIAVEFNCPAIVTNWPMSNVGMRPKGESRPDLDFLGGRAFSFIAKIVMKLEIVPDESRVLRRVVLKKHRSKAPGSNVQIEIFDGGVKDA